jgi:outer membrane protein TolC
MWRNQMDRDMPKAEVCTAACRAGITKPLVNHFRVTLTTAALALASVSPLASQQSPTPIDASASTAQASTQSSGSPAPPLVTLQDALDAAKKNFPEFLAAQAEVGIARQDKVQARAAMLPSVSYTNEYLYTEGRGGDVPRFIANNAVHEYVSQANAHEALDLGGGQFAAYRRAAANVALARAKAEIATRGLVVTVVQNYYGLVVAQRKYATAQAAATEADRFLNISQKLEQGGEVAHSDVIKAQLQYNDRSHDLREAQLAMDKARLNLAVLLYANFNQNFSVADDLRLPEPLPAFNDVQQLALKQNPQLRSAEMALKMSESDVVTARSGHFPSLTLDYWYGIDAPQFAVRSDGVRNLGYSAQASLVLPIWNWGAIQSKVRQADLRRKQARVELTAAQRELIANLNAFYKEADTSRLELEVLRQSADLAAESLRLTTLRYQAGEATVLEVVDAQNTLAQARNVYDDGEARYRIAVATLQTLTGAF